MNNLKSFETKLISEKNQKDIFGGQTVDDYQEGRNLENYAFVTYRNTSAKQDIYRDYCNVYQYGLQLARQRGGSEFWLTKGFIDGADSRPSGYRGCASLSNF